MTLPDGLQFRDHIKFYVDCKLVGNTPHLSLEVNENKEDGVEEIASYPFSKSLPICDGILEGAVNLDDLLEVLSYEKIEDIRECVRQLVVEAVAEQGVLHIEKTFDEFLFELRVGKWKTVLAVPKEQAFSFLRI